MQPPPSVGPRLTTGPCCFRLGANGVHLIDGAGQKGVAPIGRPHEPESVSPDGPNLPYQLVAFWGQYWPHFLNADTT
jgi:hypothetical protein